MEGCHPLGMLEPSVMKSILAYEDLGEDFHALYRTVLVDTPVGPYFTQFLQEVADEKAAADADHVRATFAEIPMTIIEHSIKKFYLEDFHRFCAGLGGETAAVMCDVLATRADLLTIHVTYNSLASEAARAQQRNTRSALFPSIGYMYPSGAALLERVEDEDSLRRALAKAYPEYATLWDAAPVDAVRASARPMYRGMWGGRPRRRQSGHACHFVIRVVSLLPAASDMLAISYFKRASARSAARGTSATRSSATRCASWSWASRASSTTRPSTPTPSSRSRRSRTSSGSPRASSTAYTRRWTASFPSFRAPRGQGGRLREGGLPLHGTDRLAEARPTPAARPGQLGRPGLAMMTESRGAAAPGPPPTSASVVLAAAPPGIAAAVGASSTCTRSSTALLLI